MADENKKMREALEDLRAVAAASAFARNSDDEMSALYVFNTAAGALKDVFAEPAHD